jgi:2-dehydro-3-deoxyphosphogluconate aldolase / (4S)-4-hydroxy-2-oxoglutarate aldolase
VTRPALTPASLSHPWTGGPPLIAVLRAPSAAQYEPVIDALVGSGVRAIELTMTTPDTLEQLPRLVDLFSGVATIGVGTVVDEAQATRAIDGGASYLVTPTVSSAVVAIALHAQIPVYPGGLTPTELFSGWIAGASGVKIFPASLVEPTYISDLRGPFPDLQVIPSGGVSLDNASEWITAGAVAVSVGGPLLGDAFRDGALTHLRTRAQRFCELLSAG